MKLERLLELMYANNLVLVKHLDSYKKIHYDASSDLLILVKDLDYVVMSIATYSNELHVYVLRPNEYEEWKSKLETEVNNPINNNKEE